MQIGFLELTWDFSECVLVLRNFIAYIKSVGIVVYLMNWTYLLKKLKIEYDHEDLDVF